MLLITDRDLLAIEPTLFLDAASLATVLLSGTDADIAGDALTSAASDFDAAGVVTGHVLQLSARGQAIEVTAVQDSDSLEVSLPRAATEAPAIPPGDGSALAFSVLTFERLIAQAQEWALAALGLDPEHPVTPLDEDSILNPGPVRRLIALRTIAQGFEQAAALEPSNDSLAARAALYVRRAGAAARQVAALIDLDGDGLPDVTRRIDTIVFVRR